MSKKIPAMQKTHPNLRRRTFFTPLLMPVLAAAAGLLIIAWLYSSMSTTTVVLVRHAEKMLEVEDPGLTPEGRARAEQLADMLSESGVAALFASEFRRTQETLQPLAESQGLEVTIVSAHEPDELMSAVLDIYRGKTVVIAGHSNTLPELIHGFSGLEPFEIDESEYRGIYVLSLPRYGKNRLLRLRYPQ